MYHLLIALVFVTKSHSEQVLFLFYGIKNTDTTVKLLIKNMK